jgi:uncharacterized HhH-GPD family protein
MAAQLALSQDADADRLLSEDPLALLIGMVLDQQIPLEWAFKGPYELRQRLGHDLDAADIAAMDPEVLAKAFAERPALHRYPGSMAKRVHELCQQLVEDYDGDAARVWTDAKTGEQLYRNLKRLPGFGEQKARIFLALLAKQLDVKPQGWKEQAGDYGKPGTFMSVADITSPASLLKVREYKQQKKAAAKAAKAMADAEVLAAEKDSY